MARSVNKAIILGNLGQDPELRSTPTGLSVTTLNVATTESFKDKNGEWKENTEWHRIVVWDKMAEIAHERLKKGSKVYVEGKITNRSYDGKDGVKRYVSEIRAMMVIPLDYKAPNRNNDYADDSNDEDIQVQDNNGEDIPF
ncbi:MAG: single-stranded DNA-binding protein [Ignavibacteriae bacterium HGW-Ignavibacteriae-1]|jgi:single-strand DNA-binding protein|nr:MAG: single-stranded DNA-binding protein [Ignavibacteriae bacterium HGW-Ignavibacteriae-1]